jgi:hypothetical protein
MLARLALAAAVAITATSSIARAGNGVDLVRFVPEDASMYLVVDVAGARDSALFKQGLDKLVAMAPAGFAAVTSAGVDPATALDTIAVGGSGWDKGDSDDFVVIAEGRQAQKIIDLIAKQPDAKPTRYHGVTYFGDAKGAIAIVQKRLFFAKAGHIERAIDLALGKVKGAARSTKAAALRSVIAATDTRQDVWAAIVVPAAQAQTIKDAGIDVQGLSIGATLSADVALEAKVLTANDASATTLVTQASTAMPQLTQGLAGMGLASAAKSIQIDREGSTVRLAVTLTEHEIQLILNLAGGMNFGGP